MQKRKQNNQEAAGIPNTRVFCGTDSGKPSLLHFPFHPSGACGPISQADAEAQPAGRTFSEIRLEIGRKPTQPRVSQPVSPSLFPFQSLSLFLSLPPLLQPASPPVTAQLVSQTPAGRILMVVVRGGDYAFSEPNGSPKSNLPATSVGGPGACRGASPSPRGFPGSGGCRWALSLSLAYHPVTPFLSCFSATGSSP